MSDSVRLHRQQPTRLPYPWDSPGKNTGVGCHFLLQCRKVKSESEVAQLCLTLMQLTRLLHPWDFPGKSTGVGCHCLNALRCGPCDRDSWVEGEYIMAGQTGWRPRKHVLVAWISRLQGSRRMKGGFPNLEAWRGLNFLHMENWAPLVWLGPWGHPRHTYVYHAPLAAGQCGYQVCGMLAFLTGAHPT